MRYQPQTEAILVMVLPTSRTQYLSPRSWITLGRAKVMFISNGRRVWKTSNQPLIVAYIRPVNFGQYPFSRLALSSTMHLNFSKFCLTNQTSPVLQASNHLRCSSWSCDFGSLSIYGGWLICSLVTMLNCFMSCSSGMVTREPLLNFWTSSCSFLTDSRSSPNIFLRHLSHLSPLFLRAQTMAISCCFNSKLSASFGCVGAL
ncbi:Hypothetical_protein [Hexamita inflata]|uniref:Hypothetical_protein n=1 Tax=Hexamita inflata TaxID=28002 RepID=A0AA86N5B1_9EUKA|nr:Hypothetical protein HINF_LOCUS650 [Hexamita inflata]